jgi:isochorismate hydrolase
MHACVRTTAIDAYQRDLDVIIPREAVGSYDRNHEAMSFALIGFPFAKLVARFAMTDTQSDDDIRAIGSISVNFNLLEYRLFALFLDN